MLVVHALWSPGRGVLLWAEDGERPARTSRRSLRSARPHPFAVPSAELAAVHPGRGASVTLLLPSHPAGPLDSPALVRSAGPVRSRAEPALAPWTVPGVVVDPAELLDPSPDVRYGESARHLTSVLRLAGELAERGRVLPSLDAGGREPRARWRPVIQGLDRVARTALVESMPPVARAEQRRAGDVSGHGPGELVDGALGAFADAAVRERLARATAPVRPVPDGSRGATASWLRALTAERPELTGPVEEFDDLADALSAWDDLGSEPVGPGTAVFRLAEVATLHDPSGPGQDPDDQTGDGTRWELQFALRSTEDPSLQLDAGDVWAGAADRLITGAQDLLLTDLGRAAQVLPDLVPALRRARPSTLDLDVDGAHRFLTRDASVLVTAGFGVQLPAGWNGSRPIGLRLSASSAPAPGVVTRGGLGRDELAGFRWSIAVGDDELGEQEIAALVAAKAPLVRVRGQWISVDADALARGLEFLRRERRRAPTAADVLAAQRGEVDTPLPVTGVRASGWLGDLLEGTADRTLDPLPAPDGLHATLRPYQERGLAWLAFLSSLGLGACLADDMGLGKTVQLLALECHERLPDGAHEPTLILCPMSLVGTWQREAARFAPDLRVHAHHGAARPRGDDLAARLADVDIVVTTYGTAARDVEELGPRRWHRVVLDEAQAIKNANAGASRTVRRLDAGHRIALTGTPMENRLAELWSVLDFLNPGLLGSAERFRNRFAVPIERHGDAESARTLRRITRPYLLRRVKTDPEVIDDLPEKIEILQDYRLTREQASLYRTVVDDMMTQIENSDGIQRRGNVLAAMTKLKQVCNHPAQLLHDGSPLAHPDGRPRSGKLARLEEILAEIMAAGDKVLLFTQFTEFAAMLHPHLSARFDTEVAYLHGGTSKSRRDAMVTRFQSPDGPRAFLLSLKAGGTGLTLTAANHVVHLDRWWNPAVENQATDRAFRIGQKRAVQVRKFCCPGTVEERIEALIESKRSLSGMVVSDGEDWLTDLSTGELREVFALGEQAVGVDDA